MSRGLWIVVLLLIAFVAALMVGGAALSFLARPYGNPGGEPVLVVIPAGVTANEVAELLEQRGLVARGWAFSWFLRLSGAERRIKAGEYAFTPPLAPADIARKLSRGEMNLVAVTIPEGLTVDETAAAIAAGGLSDLESLRRAFRDPAPIADLDPLARDLEGYLYPETYRFVRGVEAGRIARTLVGAFRSRFAQPEAGTIAACGRPLRELVTIASLVEKETAVGEERGLIAGVITQRLSIGMLLQIDPTIIYARKLAGTWDGDIRRRDLSWDHPYNTYTRRGLPPGPIASPGLDALRAALAPVRSGALYYVARGDGRHVFSRTLREHSAAVRAYQR